MNIYSLHFFLLVLICKDTFRDIVLEIGSLQLPLFYLPAWIIIQQLCHYQSHYVCEGHAQNFRDFIDTVDSLHNNPHPQHTHLLMSISEAKWKQQQQQQNYRKSDKKSVII